MTSVPQCHGKLLLCLWQSQELPHPYTALLGWCGDSSFGDNIFCCMGHNFVSVTSLLLPFSEYVDASKQTSMFSVFIIILFKALTVLPQSCFLQSAINRQFCVHCVAHTVQMHAIMSLIVELLSGHVTFRVNKTSILFYGS